MSSYQNDSDRLSLADAASNTKPMKANMSTEGSSSAPEPDDRWAVFNQVMDVMERGDANELAELERSESSFPHGADVVLERYWLTNGIMEGKPEAVVWMVARGVNVSYVDDEGLTPLIATLQHADVNCRYRVLRVLLEAGSDPGLIGTNRQTAAHVAAALGDVEALQILHEYGADLCAAVLDLGSWDTPAYLAAFFKRKTALEYINSICKGSANRIC